MPHPTDWLTTHPAPARELGGGSCDPCHPSQNACSVCHHPGYSPDGLPWWRIHPQAIQEAGVGPCINCHSTKTCARCHTTGEYREFD
ncbi:MAG: hypothetical protein KKA32_17200 [Actinobacteria bacterium]|nr:hypothetical protein [Actinomycetota bacterium]